MQNTVQMDEKTELILRAAQQAVAEAIERHRRLGESIVIWRDGQIVTLTSDEIPPQNWKPSAKRSHHETIRL